MVLGQPPSSPGGQGGPTAAAPAPAAPNAATQPTAPNPSMLLSALQLPPAASPPRRAAAQAVVQSSLESVGFSAASPAFSGCIVYKLASFKRLNF